MFTVYFDIFARMRIKCLFLLAAMTACLAAQAQEVLVSTVTETEAPATDSLSADTYSTGIIRQYAPMDYSMPYYDPSLSANDSLHLPLLTYDGRVLPITRFPFYRYGWGGFGTWNLHKGLNASLSASVFAQFGKNAYDGAGFAQSFSAMYATPLTPKLSLAVGGYINNVYWSRAPMRDAGLSAVLGYRIDDHWEAYLYGQKSLVENRHMPLPLYSMGYLVDRIGAAVIYHVNPSFSIGVSMEHNSGPKGDDFERTYMQHAR